MVALRLLLLPACLLLAPAAAEYPPTADAPDRSDANTDDLGAPLSAEDFAAAERLPPAPHADPSVPHADPLERAGLYEGDIVLGADDEVAHSARREPDKIWPGGEMPYTIASGFSAAERAAIASAVLELQRNTCLRLRPLAPGEFASFGSLHIVKGSGCYSWVGRRAVAGGSQQVSIGDGCAVKGIVEHELMHAAGFWHEQSRPDRDEYVRIHWDNIPSNRRHNFLKKSWQQASTLNVSYDIGSVMHYGPHSFALNWYLPTISPRVRGSAHMGQRDGMSRLDIEKVNRLYRCANTTLPSSPSSSSPPPPPRRCKDAAVCGFLVTAGWCDERPDVMARFCPTGCGVC